MLNDNIKKYIDIVRIKWKPSLKRVKSLIIKFGA